jgi:hypothetical protein
MGDMTKAYSISVGKAERKKSFGTYRRRREDNIIMDLREIGLEDVDWINLDQDREKWQPF